MERSGSRASAAARHLGATLVIAGALTAASVPTDAFAGPAGDSLDSHEDAQDARDDAIYATPNYVTPVPQGNLYSTAPGATTQVPAVKRSGRPAGLHESTPRESR